MRNNRYISHRPLSRPVARKRTPIEMIDGSTSHLHRSLLAALQHLPPGLAAHILAASSSHHAYCRLLYKKAAALPSTAHRARVIVLMRDDDGIIHIEAACLIK